MMIKYYVAYEYKGNKEHDVPITKGWILFGIDTPILSENNIRGITNTIAHDMESMYNLEDGTVQSGEIILLNVVQLYG